ncbi:unnamed protein product [Prorocentrum cordatum]|uniref:RCC1-like domain-containing protein n=1 Tax=Prorocentrum cordatum TaxID=2364126 RepID=A0ABN9X5G9_9DINO|nr:unnamed protein product [Polarella glacialis]
MARRAAAAALAWLGALLRQAAADPVVSVGAGYSHSLFLKDPSGEVYGCGHNLYGQLADNRSLKRQRPVRMLSGVQAVTAGYYHSLVLTRDGRALATGDNDYGQLGTGSTEGRRRPLEVMSAVQAVEAGGSHSLFLTASGAVHAAGYNAYGQLGDDGTKQDQLVPVQVRGLDGCKVRGMAAGTLHSLFLCKDGTVLGTGSNEDGQLGAGSANVGKHMDPVQAMLPSDAERVAAGAYHSLFLMRNSSVYASGQNRRGQLGDKAKSDRHAPVQVVGLQGQGITRIAGGFQHSLFLSEIGKPWSVGANDHGQLAEGWHHQRPQPSGADRNGFTGQRHCGGRASLVVPYAGDGTVAVSGSDFWGQLGRGGGDDQLSAVNSLVPWTRARGSPRATRSGSRACRNSFPWQATCRLPLLAVAVAAAGVLAAGLLLMRRPAAGLPRSRVEAGAWPLPLAAEERCAGGVASRPRRPGTAAEPRLRGRARRPPRLKEMLVTATT